MSQIIEVNSTAILSDADYITNEVHLGDQNLLSAMEHYINAGERLIIVRNEIKAQKARLSESNWKANGFESLRKFREWKKKQPKALNFLQWIATFTTLSERHAYKYMALAQHKDLIYNAESLAEALRMIANKDRVIVSQMRQLAHSIIKSKIGL